MNRLVSLLDTPSIMVSRFDHPGECPHHDPIEEIATEYSISRVERGHFDIEVNRHRQTLGPGHVFVCYPGLVYRCRHGDEIPSDDCLTVTYRVEVSDKEDCPSITDLCQAARRRGVLAATNRLSYLFRQFTSISHSDEGRMAAENSAIALLGEFCAANRVTHRLYPEKQLTWYAERIDAARGLLEKQYTAEQNLASLARSVGMSTFHFARIFADLVGTPPHRYLLQVRLREASWRLRQGAAVTDACFGSGFRNLSHFIRSFQRHFKTSPAKYARQRVS